MSNIFSLLIIIISIIFSSIGIAAFLNYCFATLISKKEVTSDRDLIKAIASKTQFSNVNTKKVDRATINAIHQKNAMLTVISRQRFVDKTNIKRQQEQEIEFQKHLQNNINQPNYNTIQQPQYNQQPIHQQYPNQFIPNTQYNNVYNNGYYSGQPYNTNNIYKK